MDVELNKFIKYLVNTDRSPAAKTYLSVLSSFGTWLNDRDKNLSTFTTADADEYFRNISNPNTANMFLGSLKSYMRYRINSLPVGDPRAVIETQRQSQLETIRAKKNRAKHEKVALTPDEVKELLDLISARKHRELLYAGTVLCFYFGARPMEQEHFMRSSGVKHPSVINWKNNSMMLWTTKVHHMRYLAWNEKITPYIKTWCAALPFTTPGEWITTHLSDYDIGGIHITARTGRKSVQTNFRMGGIEDWITDAVLGHVNRNSAISDTYSDFTMYEKSIKEALVEKHYMVVNEII